MIVLPVGLTPIKFPGYFWDIENDVLYSAKCGTLKPLKMYWQRYNNGTKTSRVFPHYKISHAGHHHTLSLKYLKALTLEDNEVKFWPHNPDIKGGYKQVRKPKLKNTFVLSGENDDAQNILLGVYSSYAKMVQGFAIWKRNNIELNWYFYEVKVIDADPEWTDQQQAMEGF